MRFIGDPQCGLACSHSGGRGALSTLPAIPAPPVGHPLKPGGACGGSSSGGRGFSPYGGALARCCRHWGRGGGGEGRGQGGGGGSKGGGGRRRRGGEGAGKGSGGGGSRRAVPVARCGARCQPATTSRGRLDP